MFTVDKDLHDINKMNDYLFCLFLILFLECYYAKSSFPLPSYMDNTYGSNKKKMMDNMKLIICDLEKLWVENG
jgi:hypothetical protein